MPARDGTGPMGKGSRTGRGLGNCISPADKNKPMMDASVDRSLGLGRRVWDTTFGRLFGRRRGNRGLRKG
jgi:hypothetical protein